MKYIVFSYNNKELLKISLAGYFPGELKETIELLAYEKSINQKNIKVKINKD